MRCGGWEGTYVVTPAGSETRGSELVGRGIEEMDEGGGDLIGIVSKKRERQRKESSRCVIANGGTHNDTATKVLCKLKDTFGHQGGHPFGAAR